MKLSLFFICGEGHLPVEMKGGTLNRLYRF